jgi:replicative superfamily II helicase
MATQIEIGLEIAEMARQEIEGGAAPADAFNGLIRQCLARDADWKAFYAEKMTRVKPTGANSKVLQLYASELTAEKLFLAGDYAGASRTIQSLMDDGVTNSDDKGWYLQEMARYHYTANRSESQTLQVAAHKINRLLMKPPSGVTVAKLTIQSQGRVERIAHWVSLCGDYANMNVRVSDILTRLVFGMKAEKFEHALDELSRAIGFAGERPDKEWKEGPDNLWALDSTHYLLWECKNEVEITRAEINKREAEQMNRSSAWYDKHYPGMSVKRVIVHPTNTVQSAAAFTHEVEAVREPELRKLVKSIRQFFNSFESVDFKNLSTAHIQTLIDSHHLTVANLTTDYSKKLRNLK